MFIKPINIAMKKVLRWIIGIIAALCIAVLCIWGKEISTLRTVKSVNGNPYLYQMEYKAAYDLDDVIEKDVDTNGELLDYIMGRIGKGLPIKMSSAQVAVRKQAASQPMEGTSGVSESQKVPHFSNLVVFLL